MYQRNERCTVVGQNTLMPTQTQHIHKEKRFLATTILAWSLCVLVLFAALISLILRTQNMAALVGTLKGGPADLLQEILYWAIIIPLAPPVYAIVGAIVAARRPQNSVGWICLSGGLAIGLQDAAWQYAAHAFMQAHSASPTSLFFAQFANVFNILEFPLPPTLLFLFFPNGRLISHRWRFVVWFAALLSALAVAVALFYPQISIPGDNTMVPNPIGIAGSSPLFDIINVVLLPVALFILLLALCSQVVRWRRSTGEERQQLKWLAYMAAVIAVAGVLAFFSSTLAGNFSFFSPFIGVILGAIALLGLALGIPIAIGFAMLKYRLYDLDILINRTVVYSLLTAALLLFYALCVFVLQSLLSSVVQGQEFAVVGSTLASAALFQPLRYRIQRIIDRRFYRRKYDAAQTLSAFSATLRGEVDLSQLSEHLIGVIDETMQPTHISLWLRRPNAQHLPERQPFAHLPTVPAQRRKTSSLPMP